MVVFGVKKQRDVRNRNLRLLNALHGSGTISLCVCFVAVGQDGCPMGGRQTVADRPSTRRL